MICPNCKKKTLKEIKFNEVQVDQCQECKGFWFEKDELRKAKDEKDEYLKWLDVDLWKEKKDLRVSSFDKLCPFCKKNLFEVEYGQSGVKVDICDSCQGVWLDQGEFRKIVSYLKEKVNSQTIKEYLKDALGEAREVFGGPEKLSSEMKDFILVTKLLKYRFYTQYPAIKELILHLPFSR